MQRQQREGSEAQGPAKLRASKHTWVALGLVPLCQQILVRLLNLRPYGMMLTALRDQGSCIRLLYVFIV